MTKLVASFAVGVIFGVLSFQFFQAEVEEQQPVKEKQPFKEQQPVKDPSRIGETVVTQAEFYGFTSQADAGPWGRMQERGDKAAAESLLRATRSTRSVARFREGITVFIEGESDGHLWVRAEGDHRHYYVAPCDVVRAMPSTHSF